MVNNVRPNYVNPLKMMKNDRVSDRLNPAAKKTAEKQQKTLETEKQSIQNALLLMKGTSGDSGASEEQIELLEKKLEEITGQIRVSKREDGTAVEQAQLGDAAKALQESKKLEEKRMDRLELRADTRGTLPNFYEPLEEEE